MDSITDSTSSRKRIIIRWIKLLAVIYLIVGFAVYQLQEKFLFHPTALEANEAYKIDEPHKDVKITVDPSTTFHLIQFTTAGTPRGVVLYFHGNKENVNHYAAAANTFTSNGYEIWMVDYPGFGKSTGELTEEAMYQQALQVYKMSRSRFGPGEIIIYGRSMGSGIAAYLASIRDCKHLILETPYFSLPALASRYFWMYPLERMMKFKFPTHEYLKKVTAPVTIFHGTEDGVIPYKHASRLKDVLKTKDEFVTIEGGSHNDLRTFDVLKEKIKQAL